MITTHTQHGLLWIDLNSPSESEISGIINKHNLNPLVGEELRSFSSSSKINIYKDYTMVVLRQPVRTNKGGMYSIEDREIDFVIGKNFLITSHDQTIEQLEYFAKIFDANTLLDKEKSIESAGHLFYYIVKRIYGGMFQDLENIRDTLRQAESRIFAGKEKEMVEALSFISRELIDFKQTVYSHHDVWVELTKHSEETSRYGSDFHSYIQIIKENAQVLNEQVVNSRELLADLRETNNSLLDTKQNEIIKVLTLVSFIFYPLTFIASLFTIPGVNVPLTRSSSDWWIISAIMSAVAIGIVWYFRKRGWVK
jgi:magnesium transporter